MQRFVRSRIGPALLAGAVLGVMSAGPAAAETRSQIQARLEDYIRLALSADECAFPMNADDATYLGNAIDAAIADLDLPATGYDSIMLEVSRTMRNEGWTGLCRPDGTWARQYRERLNALYP